MADETFILSALHGLVRLGDVLEPYNFRLSERGKRDREAWDHRIAARLRSRYGTLPVRVTFFAGETNASAAHQLRALLANTLFCLTDRGERNAKKLAV